MSHPVSRTRLLKKAGLDEEDWAQEALAVLHRGPWEYDRRSRIYTMECKIQPGQKKTLADAGGITTTDLQELLESLNAAGVIDKYERGYLRTSGKKQMIALAAADMDKLKIPAESRDTARTGIRPGESAAAVADTSPATSGRHAAILPTEDDPVLQQAGLAGDRKAAKVLALLRALPWNSVNLGATHEHHTEIGVQIRGSNAICTAPNYFFPRELDDVTLDDIERTMQTFAAKGILKESKGRVTGQPVPFLKGLPMEKTRGIFLEEREMDALGVPPERRAAAAAEKETAAGGPAPA